MCCRRCGSGRPTRRCNLKVGVIFLNQWNTLPSMSFLVSYFLTLRLHLNHCDYDCDYDCRPLSVSLWLWVVSLFVSLYIHVYCSRVGSVNQLRASVCVWLLAPGAQRSAPQARLFSSSCLQKHSNGRLLEPDFSAAAAAWGGKSSEQRRAHALSGLSYSNKITLTKHRLSVTPRCCSRHPNACDIHIYSFLLILYSIIPDTDKTGTSLVSGQSVFDFPTFFVCLLLHKPENPYFAFRPVRSKTPGNTSTRAA